MKVNTVSENWFVTPGNSEHSKIPDYQSKSLPKQQWNEDFISHLAAIVKCSEDAIISKSLDGTIKSWNMGSEKLFGFTAAEMIGKNISLIIPTECIDEENKKLLKIAQNESSEPYESIRMKRNGGRLYVSVTASPLKDFSGDIIGAYTIARDITELKQNEANLIKANATLAFQNKEIEKRAQDLILMNEELKQTEARLKEVNAELEAFTYSVSHDLRAPLRAINSYAQILSEDYAHAIDSDGRQVISHICQNSKKMGALIDELLAFSRLGRKDIERSKIDMNKLAVEVLSDLKRITEYNATIKISLLPSVQADYTLLRQVIYNLLSNAIKYSSKKEQALIKIYTLQQKGKTVFAIEDNGAGFDMRFADKLFGVFQRLHSEKDFEGNGVGLAIVQRIIFKHGGTVWAEGRVNEGATFYFTLN